MQKEELHLVRLQEDTEIKHFDSGDEDLNRFLYEDAKEYSKQFLAVTYLLEDQNNTISYFSLSNDLLFYSDIDNKSKWRKFTKLIGLNFQKRKRKSYPAVKLGRLATNKEYQSMGFGKIVIDWIKYSFTNNNKTGCLFITVDAYNNSGAVKFYENNGFQFVNSNTEKDNTRLMYCSLLEEIN